MRYLKTIIIVLLIITVYSEIKIVKDGLSEPPPSTSSNVEIRKKRTNTYNNLLVLKNVKDNVEVEDEVETLRISTKENIPIKKEDKPIESKRNKTTYGDIRYIDETIPYKTLKDKLDPNKEKGSSSIITKGQNGLQRKEVRDVFINGKLSHTETFKEFYIVKDPIHAQNWIGTKEPKSSNLSGPQDIRTDYSISHPQDFTNHAGNIMYYYATFYDYDEALAQGWKPADQYGFDGYSILQEDTDKWFFYLHSE